MRAVEKNVAGSAEVVLGFCPECGAKAYVTPSGYGACGSCSSKLRPQDVFVREAASRIPRIQKRINGGVVFLDGKIVKSKPVKTTRSVRYAVRLFLLNEPIFYLPERDRFYVMAGSQEELCNL